MSQVVGPPMQPRADLTPLELQLLEVLSWAFPLANKAMEDTRSYRIQNNLVDWKSSYYGLHESEIDMLAKARERIAECYEPTPSKGHHP